MIGAVVLYTEWANQMLFTKAESAGDTVEEDQVRSVWNVCRPRFACFNLPSGVATLAAPYLCFWMLSNPFSNWATSGISPDWRPLCPMTRQR